MPAANVTMPKPLADAYTETVATYNKCMSDLVEYGRNKVKPATLAQLKKAADDSSFPKNREQLEIEYAEKRRAIKRKRFDALEVFGAKMHPFYKAAADLIDAHVAALEAGEEKDMADFGLEPVRSSFIRQLFGAVELLRELHERTANPESIALSNPRDLAPWMEHAK